MSFCWKLLAVKVFEKEKKFKVSKRLDISAQNFKFQKLIFINFLVDF